MSSTPELIYAGRAELAEGPVWHSNALWWVDIAVGTLNRFDLATEINQARATGDFLGTAVPCTDGRWLLARRRDCAFLNWETGELFPFSSPPGGTPSRHRLNDGKCDPTGRFWVGTMSLDHAPSEAALFAVEPNGQVRSMLNGVSLSNGLGWSPGGDRFYHIDTPTRRVSSFDFEPESGKLGERKTLIEFADSDGFPDGMAIDSAGNLWIALWSGYCVARVDGRSGAILEKHRLPVAQVSSCAFGGPDLSTLFITTAWENLSFAEREAQPLAGSLFALRTETPGLPVTLFQRPKDPKIA